MTKELYNGWSNRETWLVNLHFGDSFEPMLKEDLEEEKFDTGEDENETKAAIAARYQDFVEELLAEELAGLGMFLSDFIDLGRIDWYDLAESIYQDL